MMNCILASARTFPPWLSEGWTLIGIERDSRYLVSVQVGQRDRDLFTRGVAQTWEAVQRNKYIRLFSDGERRYASELWKLASVRLERKYGDYHYRKVWREGIELAILTSCTTIILQDELILTSSPKKRVALVCAQFPATIDSQQSEALTVRESEPTLVSTEVAVRDERTNRPNEPAQS